jgi:hypothetical protein
VVEVLVVVTGLDRALGAGQGGGHIAFVFVVAGRAGLAGQVFEPGGAGKSAGIGRTLLSAPAPSSPPEGFDRRLACHQRSATTATAPGS